MKKTFATLLTAGFVCLHSAHGYARDAYEIWLAPNGSDENPGTKEKPLASLSSAQRRARELRRLNDPLIAVGIRIVLRDGVYLLEEPVLFRFEDSGTEASPTIIQAAAGEHPVFSGGAAITNWHQEIETIPALPAAARGNIWTADTLKINGHPMEFRQLWINGVKATRARQPNGDSMGRLLGWDRAAQEASLPAETLAGLLEPSQAEIFFHQQWEIAICRIRSIQIEGDRAIVKLRSPEGPIQFEHPWPQPVMSTNGNAPFFLANAIELLDQPGEWFQDLTSGRIYYWPRPGEDLSRAEVIAPVLETLVQIGGTLDQPVTHLEFNGIEFSHSTWLRPSRSGHVPLQAGMFLLEAHKLSPKGTSYHAGLDNQAWIGRPPGAVSVKNAAHVTFERCRFTHLASAGLDFQSGTHDDVIEGCVFKDIGGNGIQLGKFSDAEVETHRPYNPIDEREICTRERIANNFVTDCANEDWGCVGIGVGYGRAITIEHNELSNLPYTGISLGWGWNKATNCMKDNRVFANHVHHVATRMCDTAGIYTLSPQLGTIISENSVHDIQMSPYVSDPHHWFYLYLDEGSSFITVRDNWCPSEKFLKNANGPGNEWINNGPAVSLKIKEAAGLEADFKDLLSHEQ